MSVTGNWVNSYNSVMYLTQSPNGFVSGVYTSTTGSSGAYWVAGFATPTIATQIGEPLAFSILWRSFSGGQSDPSWHYVSGMSGQMLANPSLIMIHDMVATERFPALNAQIGNYFDKLIYVPYDGPQESPGQWPPPFTPPPKPDPVDGTWTCVQDPSISFTIAVQDQQTGFVTGTLTTAESSCEVVGFTDTGAGAAELALQGLTLSALLPGGQEVVAIAGSLDLATNALSMQWMQSNGTASNATYLQTRVEGMNFK